MKSDNNFTKGSFSGFGLVKHKRKSDSDKIDYSAFREAFSNQHAMYTNGTVEIDNDE